MSDTNGQAGEPARISRRWGFEFTHGELLFTDEYGTVWKLVPTGDPAMPLQIMVEKRP